MAIVHRERQLPDWPGFMLPDRWRRIFELGAEEDGWLKLEEYRDGSTLVLRTEVPGVDPDNDLEVTVDEGVLRIHAHREAKAEQKNKSGYRSEFRYGDLTRTVRLPEGVVAEDVKATYRDGVLEVRLPVPAEKQSEVKKVPVSKA